MNKAFIMCGGYYPNFSYPKSLTVINGEALVDRTIRLLSVYDDIKYEVCCNLEETAFDAYNHQKCNFTYNHITWAGYYLDIYDAVDFTEPCIFLFGDVYYTEDSIVKIINKFHETERNIFICNKYPFNDKGLRQGEPFGWVVKDVTEFKASLLLGKRFQDRGIITNIEGVPSNWELAHIINGLAANDFCLRKEDCLIIDDLTIDVDDPSVIEKIAKERQ